MRYYIKITTNKCPEIIWIKGGLGYDESDIERIKPKLEKDSRILRYEIKEMPNEKN